MKNKIVTLSKGNQSLSWHYGNYGTSWKAKGSIKDRKIAPMLRISVEGNDPNSLSSQVTIKYQRGFTFYNQNCTTKIKTELSFSCSNDTTFSKNSQIQEFSYKYNAQDKNLKPHEVQFNESSSATNPETSFTIKREFGKEKICELNMLVSRDDKNESNLCIRIPICERKQEVVVTDGAKYNKTFYLGSDDGINFQQLLNNPAKKVTYNYTEYQSYSPGVNPLNNGNKITFQIGTKNVSQGITYNINFKASYSKNIPFSSTMILISENPPVQSYLSTLQPIKTGYNFIGWTIDNERMVEEPENDYDFKIISFDKNETFLDLNKSIANKIYSQTKEDKFNNLTIFDLNTTIELSRILSALDITLDDIKKVSEDGSVVVNLNLAAVWQRNLTNPEDIDENDISNFVLTPINKIFDRKLINTNLLYGQMVPMLGSENEYAINNYDRDGLYECVEDANGTVEAFYPKGLNGNNTYINQNIEKFDGNYYISLKDLYIDKNNFENNKDVLLKQSDKDNLLLNIKLTPSSKIPQKFTKVLLSDYGKHENTMNGLILYLNQLVDFSNTGERNFTTIKGLLNVLKDEINRIGFYSVDTVSNLNYKIGKLETKINEKLNLLDEIASDKDVAYAKEQVNKRINQLLIGQEYGGSDDNKNYEFEQFLYPIGLDNNYSFFGNQVKTASTIQEAFNNVYSIIGSDNSPSSENTILSMIKDLQQQIIDVAETAKEVAEKQEEERKENEYVHFEVCESSNQAFSSIRLESNESKYNPNSNTVYISLKVSLTTNKNVDKILNNADNGLPKGLVKLTQDSQKYNVSSSEKSLSATQTGYFSRNYNARIERSLGGNYGVIVLSTTHDLKSNTTYGLQIDGCYLLGDSSSDSSDTPYISYTINGSSSNVKALQGSYASPLKVPGDLYSGTNKSKKQSFTGWYYGDEKITDAKGVFSKGTSIIDMNGGFKALSGNIALQPKYGTAKTVSSLKDTTWSLVTSNGKGTGGDIISVPTFVSNKNTYVRIYVSYDKNGKPYTVTYHKKNGNKTKVYVEGKLKVSSNYKTIKFTGSSCSESQYAKISGFLKQTGGTVKYK